MAELVAHVSTSRWKGAAAHRSQTTNAMEIVALIGAHKPVTDLNKADIDRARGKLLDRGNQPSTVNRKVAALSTCLTEARDMGLIAVKPKCAKYRESDHRIRRFSKAEEAEALSYFMMMSEPDMADFVALSLDTGLRQGEMLNLRYRDADGRTVTVWGTGSKNGRTRSVPLTRRAIGILAARQERLAAAPGDLVIPMSRYALRWQWEKLACVLGVEQDKQFVPHILRHEFCSRLAERDLSAVVIQQLAGHSCLAVTQRYVHVRAEHLVRAIQALEAEASPATEA
ncbi:site-specific integrase [Methylobacterium sp. P1-11]|uniref:tyrosine-type recombinase/integrase n=1 Tax=Methylobacterium sp. P1-11 TaxID=2024616 RepID=UPI00156311B1|nr:site-specific integrase [Methylobacterium sp. P1-11]